MESYRKINNWCHPIVKFVLYTALADLLINHSALLLYFSKLETLR